MPVPEPLVRPVCDRPQSRRKQSGDQHRFIEPCGENAVQHAALEVRLIDPDRLEVRLMIEAAGGVVVARRIGRSDVVRHVETTRDFVKQFAFKIGVRA